MRPHVTATLLVCLLASAPSAALANPSTFAGRYLVDGVGPEGGYDGSVVVSRSRSGKRYQVSLRTLDGQGRERLARATARARGDALRFVCRATREARSERPLRASLRRLDRVADGLVVTYRDAEGLAVRREHWRRTDLVRIPLQVVALDGLGTVSPRRAREALARILAQLNAVFADVDVAFQSVTSEPARIDGARFDADQDGRLSTTEARALRDALELEGLKRRGRVVLVLTNAPFAHAHGRCRGWTLGDAPATPHSLSDLNDNLSLVGLSYLDRSRFHTVAHEVAHQLGLDDLNAKNRKLLSQPSRRDHLMVSGGSGLHLDRRAARMLRNTTRQFPNYGLEGRVGNPVTASAAPRIAAMRNPWAEGLPAPEALRK